MQFLTAQKEVAAHLGVDYTESGMATLLKRWLNLSQTDIAGSWDWSWLETREAIDMETDYTTGTVSVNSASTAITFSSGPTASQTNRYIQFSSANDWYKITAHTAGETAATIDPAYIQTSNLSAGTFTIRTKFYSLASTTEKVYSCREAVNQTNIGVIWASEADLHVPFSTATASVPQKIYLWGRDSNNYLQFTPYPWPSAVSLLEFRVYKKLTDLSSDTDTPIFPARFDSIWIEGATIYGFRFLDDDRENSAYKSFWSKVDYMKERDNPDSAKHRVLRGIDEHPTPKTIIPFPPEFGDVS